MAQVCDVKDTPFLIVRAISDFAAENSVAEFKRSLRQSALGAARIVLGMVKSL